VPCDEVEASCVAWIHISVVVALREVGTRRMDKRCVHSFRHMSIWIITKLNKAVQNLMFCVGELSFTHITYPRKFGLFQTQETCNLKSGTTTSNPSDEWGEIKI